MLEPILRHLNANSGAYSVVFSALVTAATVMYAILTRTLVVETRRMREAQTEPEISVAAVPSRTWLNHINMEIVNVGAGPAFKVKMKAEPNFEHHPGEFLSDLGPFKNGIVHLPAGARIVFYFTSAVGEGSETRLRSPFKILLDYQNREGQCRHAEYEIDLSYMENLSTIDSDPLIGLRKHAEEISKTLTDWSAKARHEIEYRMWQQEAYFFTSRIGTFWIRPQPGAMNFFRLGIGTNQLKMYATPNLAAEAVHQHQTGYELWDSTPDQASPEDLRGWEFGRPEISG